MYLHVLPLMLLTVLLILKYATLNSNVNMIFVNLLSEIFVINSYCQVRQRFLFIDILSIYSKSINL